MGSLTIHQAAITLAERFVTDETFNANVSEIVRAGETTKRSALIVMADIERVMTPEEIDNLPIVGSTITSNPNNYDKYESQVSGEKVTGTFFNDFADDTPIGQQAVAVKNALEQWKSNKLLSKPDVSGLPEGFTYPEKMTDVVKAITVARQRRDAVRTLINKAFRLKQLLLRIERECPKIKCIIPMDGDGYNTSTIPVSIWNVDDPTDNENWSVNTLLTLGAMTYGDDGKPTGKSKLDVIINNGGTWTALKAVLKREREDKDKESKERQVRALVIKEPNQLASVANVFLSYFKDENGKLDQKAYAKLLTAMNTDDELVMAIRDLSERFEDLATKAERRISDITAKQLAGPMQQAV